MTAVYILGGIIIFLFLIMILPISADIIYRDKLFIKVKYAGIKVFDSTAPKREKTQKAEDKPKTAAEKPKKENFITRTFKEKGKIEGIRFFAELIKLAFSRIIWVIKGIKLKKLCLDISVASDNAATTAVAYGIVCGAVYPAVNLIDQNTDISLKQVSIYTNFEKLSPEIAASVLAKTRLFFAVVAAVSMLFAYLRLKKESDKNGRK